MFFRFIPTRSTELRTKTARDSRVRSTIVPVVGLVASGAVTTRILPWPARCRAAWSFHSPPYDSPDIMTIPASGTMPSPRLGTDDPAGDRRRWIALIVVCLAMFMNALDGSIVHVALPDI